MPSSTKTALQAGVVYLTVLWIHWLTSQSLSFIWAVFITQNVHVFFSCSHCIVGFSRRQTRYYSFLDFPSSDRVFEQSQQSQNAFRKRAGLKNKPVLVVCVKTEETNWVVEAVNSKARQTISTCKANLTGNEGTEEYERLTTMSLKSLPIFNTKSWSLKLNTM